MALKIIDPSSYRFLAEGEGDTRAFASHLAQLLDEGSMITLSGDLGAGKTTFTQGLAKGLGIREQVNSPTFTIIKEYQGRLPLYHMDVYRLGGSEDLGFEEYFYGNGITVVEWPSLIEEDLPDQRLHIDINVISLEEREIHLTPYGEKYVNVCKELTHEYSRV